MTETPATTDRSPESDLRAAEELAAHDLPAAEELARRSAAEAERAGAWPTVGDACRLAARISVLRGDPRRALADLDRAASAYREVGDTLAAIRTGLGRMHVFDELGRHHDAVHVGETMLSELDALDGCDPEAVDWLRAATEGNTAVAFGYLGRHADAAEAHRRSATVWDRLGLVHERAIAGANRGIELLWLGRAHEAHETLSAAFADFRRAEDEVWAGKCLQHRATARLHLGALGAALDDAREARAALETVGAEGELVKLDLVEAEALRLLGLESMAAGRFARAAEHAERLGLTADHARAVVGQAVGAVDADADELAAALRTAVDVGDESAASLLRVRLADLAADVDALRHLADEATHALRDLHRWVAIVALVRHDASAVGLLDQIAETGPSTLLVEADILRGRVAYDEGRMDDALVAYRRAHDLALQSAVGVRDVLLGTGVDGGRRAAIAGLVAARLARNAPGDVDAALVAVGLDRTRTVRLLRRSPSTTSPRSHDVPELRAQLDSAYSQLLGVAVDEARRAEIEGRIDDLRARMTLGADPAPPKPDTAEAEAEELVAPGDPSTPADEGDEAAVLAALDEAGRSITFARDEHRGVLVAFRRDSGRTDTTVHDLDTVDRLVDDVRRTTGVADARRDRPQRRALGTRARRRLHDELVAPSTDGHEGIDRPRPIVIVPDTGLHDVPFGALEDTAGEPVDRRWIVSTMTAFGVAPPASPAPRQPGRVVAVGLSDDRAPRAEAEAEAVAARWPQATLLVGDRATPEAVRGAMHTGPDPASSATVVHLAGHALHRPHDPTRSAFRLHGGWLDAADLAEMSLSGATVVLSGCDTGAADGVEPFGLARAVAAAGASDVIVAAWEIDDAATAAFMSDVHTALSDGVTAACAVRAARLAAHDNDLHPGLWAGFIHHGHPRTPS